MEKKKDVKVYSAQEAIELTQRAFELGRESFLSEIIAAFGRGNKSFMQFMRGYPRKSDVSKEKVNHAPEVLR